MLTIAGGDQNLDCLKLILQAGSDFKCKDDFGNTLLHIAAKNNCNKMIDYLAKNLKINIFERNKEGETALNICQNLKNEKGIAILTQFQGQYDQSKALADELMDELCKEEEENEEAKAKRRQKKWRNKINRIAKAENISPEEVEARLQQEEEEKKQQEAKKAKLEEEKEKREQEEAQKKREELRK